MISVLIFFKILLSINLLISASDISSKDNRRLSLTAFNSKRDVSNVSFKDIRSAINSVSCSRSTSNGTVRRQRSRLSPTNLVADDSKSRAAFHQKCLNMSNVIKGFAMKQLGLKGSRNLINFSDYNITNWPIFVPFRFMYWDQKALVDLKAALPTMKFVKKSAIEMSNNSAKNRLLKSLRLLLDLFMESYKRQTNKINAQVIMWFQYHLKNWPRNVKLQSDKWNFPEILTLYRHLDHIQFEPVLPGQQRTITYADGEVEITHKRKFKSDSSESEDEMVEDVTSSGSSSANFYFDYPSSSTFLESDDLMDLGIIRDEDKEPHIFEQSQNF